MTRTEQLEELFDKWQEKQKNENETSLKETKIESNNISQVHFCKDGIIDEKIYDSQKIKVLFIAKEPNIDYENNGCVVSSQIDDFIKYYKKGIDEWHGRLRINICKYYMWMFPELSDENNRSKVAKHFAFMNLNKRGGGEQADNERIAKYCKNYRDEILNEIKIISPDIIVWLGFETFDKVVEYKIFDIRSKELENNTYKYYFVVNNKAIPLLREYHPSKPFVKDSLKRERIQKDFNRFKEELNYAVSE